MTTSKGREGSAELEAALALGRKELATPGEEELAPGLDQFVARVARKKARAQRPWVPLVLGTASVAIVALMLVKVLAPHATSTGRAAPSLAYRLEGGTLLEDGYLHETGHGGMKLDFNDGSRVSLAAGARGRVRVVDRDDAQVTLQSGQAAFRIVHKDQRRWVVDAGPFRVRVTGTAFTLAWDPLGEQMELTLREGSVVVTGPFTAGELTMRAGQRLVSNLRKVETVMSQAPPEGAESPAPAPGAPVPDAAPGTQPAAASLSRSLSPALSAAAPRHRQAAPQRRWSAALARGAWDLILEEAERAGVASTFDDAGADDLLALGNAARYRQRFEIARGALLAVRRRFAGTPRALEATYLLGRVEESRDPSAALASYDAYLAQAPAGALAGEALGRKMTLTHGLRGAAAARGLAEDYLRRFPQGNYAASARELLAR